MTAERGCPTFFGPRIEVVRFLLGPAVATQPGHGDLERIRRALGMALEEPLGRVVAVGFGETVRVFLGGDLLPALEVEWDLYQGLVSNLRRLIDVLNVGDILWRL